MSISPRGFVVKAPKIAATPRYGLLNTIEPITLSDPHWQSGGVEWEQDLCTKISSFIDECPPATGFTKDANRDLEFCHADPFVIHGSFDCSPIGRPPADAFEIARRRLLAWESHELEHILWTGQSKNGQVNPSFAFGNTECDLLPQDLSPGGCQNIVSAIAILEQALTQVVPGGGIIHAPAGVASYLAQSHLLERQGDRYFTPTGTPIILGAGYDGTGPGGVAATAGCTWIYATGPLGIWRSNVFMVPNDVAEGINRSVNNITARAERFYATGFSCALFAVRATLSCACC